MARTYPIAPPAARLEFETVEFCPDQVNSPPIHDGVAIAGRVLAALQTENNWNTTVIASFSGRNIPG